MGSKWDYLFIFGYNDSWVEFWFFSSRIRKYLSCFSWLFFRIDVVLSSSRSMVSNLMFLALLSRLFIYCWWLLELDLDFELMLFLDRDLAELLVAKVGFGGCIVKFEFREFCWWNCGFWLGKSTLWGYSTEYEWNFDFLISWIWARWVL